MCGIVGYVGKEEAAPILLHSLQRLEYRGYDSAGIATRFNDGKPIIVKAKGKLTNLINKTDDGKMIHANWGIGHTRWATHGTPTENNAHPHFTDDYNVIGVHNGIIENYHEIKDFLLENGYEFHSDTDTEIIIKYIDFFYKKQKVEPLEALNLALNKVKGYYALALMFKDYPNKVFFAKNVSPLIIAKGKDAYYIASDIPAVLKYSNQVYYVDDLECGYITADEVKFFDIDGKDITDNKFLKSIDWHTDSIDLGNWPHYMLKEIFEQPKVVNDTINAYLDHNNNLDFSILGIDEEFLKKLHKIYIFGCGSSYHAGLLAQFVLEELTKIDVRVEIASEFKYRNFQMEPDSLAIILSQSGETKDSYEAMMKAKRNGIKTLAITNVKGSTITREADYNAYIYAGPEIAVATTKAYSCQLIVLYLFSVYLAKIKGLLNEDNYQNYLNEIKNIPNNIQKILDNLKPIQALASHFMTKNDIFFIGRGIDYVLSLEGALKLKTTAYLNANAYPAGELKHGPISLISSDILTIGVATQPNILDKTISNMVEVDAREGLVVSLSNEGTVIKKPSIYQLNIPKINPLFSGSLAIVPLQLMSYYVAVAKGYDPDRPRNLAKSVTVE